MFLLLILLLLLKQEHLNILTHVFLLFNSIIEQLMERSYLNQLLKYSFLQSKIFLNYKILTSLSLANLCRMFGIRQHSNKYIYLTSKIFYLITKLNFFILTHFIFRFVNIISIYLMSFRYKITSHWKSHIT